MSKVLLINGSPNQRGCVSVAIDALARTLEKNGVEAEILWLGKKPMQDCVACGHCVQAGKCVFDDAVNEVGARIDEFDGIVVGSPVYYSGPNARLTAFLDRLFFSVPTEKFAGKLGASIVSCRRGGSTASFERLNQFFLMNHMTVVGSQYWNQIHGNTAEDALQDAEGLQTMRSLGQNMAWLLKAIALADQNGIPRPEYEPHILTNFIR